MRLRLFAWLPFALALGCATSERPVRPSPPPSSAELAMGRTDAISLGSDYAAQLGYRDSELLGVEQVHPNIWRVKFGLAPKGSGKILQLDFDGQNRTLLKRTELDGVTGTMAPDSSR